ncbi:Membrane protein involved in the export of O-antigen and teichoic acid [Marinobacter segnicrescens]|uniref:Membrane protein involved in the export of O-antigen and teichoic acid n=1 Tax=Marinobacter segnicrescens TaxID=430453 RepID=A0A1I0H1B1_9GAMM|nr:oligosaccharide flippase family protein [Marinobacter segnicrescens]SET77483.1 Membrane protein involved in the export of O-antigen and teichoic acid [Marinobacter segnicrescens]
MSASLKVLKSAGLLFGIQVVQRGLGIISTLILARLLAPEHFGIVALVTIALQFFELLVETGNRQYIVQKETLDDEDLDTAWSMDILIKSSLAVLVIASSPALARWFDEPALTAALAVAALALPIRALRTPGMMRLAREINYRPLFRLTLWQKGLSFMTVITIAFIDPSHWAIIAGNLVSAAVLAVGSYRVDRHRPRWTLSRFRQQWGFSQWLLLRGIVGFTRSQVDNLLVSRFFGTTALGGYNLVREVSLLPALSAIIPMSEPLLAAIAQSRESRTNLAYRVSFSLALMITVLTPITVFIMLYPELIVRVLLGTQWTEFAPLLQPFGLFFFTFCLFSLISDAVIAQGKVKGLFWFDLTSTTIILATLYWFATDSLNTMAWARGWLAVATTGVLLLILQRQTRFGAGHLLLLCLPTALGSTVSALVTISMDVPWELPLVEFLVRGTVFVLLAAISTVALAMLFLRQTTEWQQLMSLIRPMIEKYRN